MEISKKSYVNLLEESFPGIKDNKEIGYGVLKGLQSLKSQSLRVQIPHREQKPYSYCGGDLPV
jgi:hypothetical protein